MDPYSLFDKLMQCKTLSDPTYETTHTLLEIYTQIHINITVQIFNFYYISQLIKSLVFSELYIKSSQKQPLNLCQQCLDKFQTPPNPTPHIYQVRSLQQGQVFKTLEK